MNILMLADVFYPDTVGGAGRVVYHLGLIKSNRGVVDYRDKLMAQGTTYPCLCYVSIKKKRDSSATPQNDRVHGAKGRR